MATPRRVSHRGPTCPWPQACGVGSSHLLLLLPEVLLQVPSCSLFSLNTTSSEGLPSLLGLGEAPSLQFCCFSPSLGPQQTSPPELSAWGQEAGAPPSSWRKESLCGPERPTVGLQEGEGWDGALCARHRCRKRAGH